MRRIGSAVLGLSLAGFSLWGSAADGQVPAGAKAVLGAWGVDLSGMDRRVKPGDDFFRYVNGAWFDTAEIPARPHHDRVLRPARHPERDARPRHPLRA